MVRCILPGEGVEVNVLLLRAPATAEDLSRMLEAQGAFVKCSVDVERGVLAGGGEYHADAEALLLEDGSLQKDIWGADWYPQERRVTFEAVINLRPRDGNRSMLIQDASRRKLVESIVRKWLEGSRGA